MLFVNASSCYAFLWKLDNSNSDSHFSLKPEFLKKILSKLAFLTEFPDATAWKRLSKYKKSFTTQSEYRLSKMKNCDSFMFLRLKLESSKVSDSRNFLEQAAHATVEDPFLLTLSRTVVRPETWTQKMSCWTVKIIFWEHL